MIQNYSLYNPHKIWSAKYLVCKMSPLWSTADRSMVLWSAWFGLQTIPNPGKLHTSAPLSTPSLQCNDRILVHFVEYCLFTVLKKVRESDSWAFIIELKKDSDFFYVSFHFCACWFVSSTSRDVTIQNGVGVEKLGILSSEKRQ